MTRDVQEDPIDRAALRAALLEAAPWLATADVGPAAVDAGDCDRCGSAPRVLPTCGPVPFAAVCRDCGLELGDDGWCDGHVDEGAAARRWASRLPAGWQHAVLLWWFATGELRELDLTALDLDDVGVDVRRALP